MVVHALRSADVTAAVEAADGLPEHARTSRINASLISLSLHHNGERMFPSADYVLDLPDHELSPLSKQVNDALRVCSPQLGRCDYDVWADALLEGARDPSNTMAVRSLGGCISNDYGGRTDERIQDYYGVPKCQLLDGHWFVYWAARKVYDQRYKVSA